MRPLATLTSLLVMAAALSCSGSSGRHRAASPDPARYHTPDVDRAAAAPSADVDLEPRHVTLDQALAHGRERHPDVALAQARLAAAAARVAGAGLLPNPEAIVRMESAPLDEGSTTGDAEYLLGISQPLPLGERRAAERALAAYQRDRAVSDLAVVVRDVEQRVRGAYGTALYGRQVSDARRELLALSTRQLELARSRVAAGDMVASELTTLELREVDDRFELERALDLETRALRSLQSAMASDAPVASVDGELLAVFDLPALTELIDQLDRDPALLAAQAQGDVARARSELAEELRVPDVRLDLLYRRMDASDVDAFDVGLAIPLRLFDDGRSRVRESQALVSVAEAAERATRLELEGSVRNAHLRASRALAQVAVLEAELLPRARRQLELMEARHAAGDIGLDGVLTARRGWQDVRLTRLQALDETMVAWVELSAFLR
jgi:cobalt-zinc-cadmium efflux system outer membrane protein